MNIEQALSPKDPVSEVGYKAFRNLVQNGHMSITWVEHREVYLKYLQFKSQDQRSAARRTAETLDKSLDTVYYIIKRFE